MAHPPNLFRRRDRENAALQFNSSASSPGLIEQTRHSILSAVRSRIESAKNSNSEISDFESWWNQSSTVTEYNAAAVALKSWQPSMITLPNYRNSNMKICEEIAGTLICTTN